MEKVSFDSINFSELWEKENELANDLMVLSFEEVPDVEKMKLVVEERKKLRTEIDKLLLPVYKEMRRMNFVHNDLVG